MKIAIASMGDPKSVKTWSGIPAHIYFALEARGHELHGITLEIPKEPWHYNWKRRIHHHLQRRWFLSAVDELWLKRVGKQFDEAVAKINPEIIIVFHGDFLAHTSFKQGVCFIHDATWATLVGYYSAFTNLTTESIRSGHMMYQRAIEQADAAVFSSGWASTSAINDYHADVSKVHTIPLGANIREVPDIQEVESWISERLLSDSCNLLFLGVDWERKGGPDALKFVAELNRLGIESFLTIAGCTPHIPEQLEPFVRRIGFLRKDVESEAKKLEALLKESHALLLPSLAECYGCVYCEANAYGLPALGRDTGGVPEIIKDGINGLLLREGEPVEIFAQRWAKTWNNREAYMQMSINSRKEYDERLNYDVFISTLEPILEAIILKKKKIKLVD